MPPFGRGFPCLPHPFERVARFESASGLIRPVPEAGYWPVLTLSGLIEFRSGLFCSAELTRYFDRKGAG